MTFFRAIGLIVFLYAITILMPSVFAELESTIIAVLELITSLANGASTIEISELGSATAFRAPTVIMTPGLQ